MGYIACARHGTGAGGVDGGTAYECKGRGVAVSFLKFAGLGGILCIGEACMEHFVLALGFIR